MTCAICHATGPGAYKLGRGQAICDVCVRAAAAAWGWGPRPEGPPPNLFPLLGNGLDLLDHEVLYRPVVTIDRPFSVQSARHRDEVNPLAQPGRLISLAAPPRRWDSVGLDCAAGLLRFRVPEGDEPSTMQSLLEHWNHWANYLELLPTGPLRTYLEAIQELICNRWQQSGRPARRVHPPPRLGQPQGHLSRLAGRLDPGQSGLGAAGPDPLPRAAPGRA